MSEPLSRYATEIYERGVVGARPAFTTDPTRLEEVAEQVMAPEAFWYVAGSATSGSTARENRAAFERWRIVPRMLTGATSRDTSATVLGSPLRAPIITAPVGAQGIVHPDGELAAARVTAELRLGMTLSTLSSRRLEEVAAANGDGVRWFQLYWPNDDDVCVSLLRRAAAAGYRTLLVTLDTWLLGWRPRDLDHGFLPFLTGEGLANYFSDEAFCALLARPPAEDVAGAVQRWVPCFTGTDRTWEQLAFLRSHWDGPIVLKGIQHVDDAKRAVEAGVEGIVVSNHGGRQVDGAIASLDALPAVADAVGEDLTVLFDSGIRTGADVVKALCLGARAVLVARPWVYGLALGGTDGVRHVLRGLLADTELAFALSGHRDVACLGRDVLVHTP
jgi:isopentenyl diphosphate isomerase/L-lactate dehydrogenase-like FMN-dependent dehydrogenase